jgi:DNA polymerase/3'-5' exonuclease PolX
MIEEPNVLIEPKDSVSWKIAADIADKIIDLIAPVCEGDRAVVAGSIRRRKPFVKDIEIVCQPLPSKRPAALFAEPVDAIDPEKIPTVIDRLLNRVCSGPGPLQFDQDLKRNGRRYKRLDWDGIKVDLFIVTPPASWGALLAIRTGPAEFGHLVVTKRSNGGAMPDGINQHRGSLWGPSGVIETPEEEDFFAALGLPTWLAWERTTDRLLSFLRLPAEAQVDECRHQQPAFNR